MLPWSRAHVVDVALSTPTTQSGFGPRVLLARGVLLGALLVLIASCSGTAEPTHDVEDGLQDANNDARDPDATEVVDTTPEDGISPDGNELSDDTSDPEDSIVPSDATGGPIAIAGSYTDDYATRHEVRDETWEMASEYGASVFHVALVDTDASQLVAFNDDANAFSPGLWSRFDWTQYQGALWYCQATYTSASQEEAVGAAPSDPTDPSTGGCAGFPWTRLLPREPLPIVGWFTDDYGMSHVIGEMRWEQSIPEYPEYDSTFHIVVNENGTGVVHALNDSGNQASPGAWSRFDWLERDGALWYCQTTFTAATLAEAQGTTPADETDPSAGGCNGLPWSRMTPDV